MPSHHIFHPAVRPEVGPFHQPSTTTRPRTRTKRPPLPGRNPIARRSPRLNSTTDGRCGAGSDRLFDSGLDSGFGCVFGGGCGRGECVDGIVPFRSVALRGEGRVERGAAGWGFFWRGGVMVWWGGGGGQEAGEGLSDQEPKDLSLERVSPSPVLAPISGVAGCSCPPWRLNAEVGIN